MTTTTSLRAAVLVCGLVFLGMVQSGCKSSPSKTKVTTQTGGVTATGGSGGAVDARPDGPTANPDGKTQTCSSNVGSKTRGKGETCGCNDECQTGFCVAGICCSSACTEGCKACTLPGSPGECTLVPSGVRPVDPKFCSAGTPATCGLDGFCDGKGVCRKFVKGTDCSIGDCNGDVLLGGKACDGNGNCSEPSIVTCAPFACDASEKACFSLCTNDKQCTGGQKCVNGSCGLKVNGAKASKASECLSGYLADGVCCNGDCSGACVSCKEPGNLGRCTYIGAGQIDTDCKGGPASSCGNTGQCDGFGSCAKYPANTICAPSTCSGTASKNDARICDGKGNCKTAGVVACSPFLCTNGTCNSSCASNKDCEPGIECVLSTRNGVATGTCGKRENGQTCSLGDDCQSGQCVDGVCCENSCEGACRSCGLPGSLGQCVMVADKAPDPRGACKDQGKANCGTNGLCDGSGVCSKYAVGEECADSTCVVGSYTPPSTCIASGQCVASRSITCAPTICKDSKDCYKECTNDSQCVPGKFCVNASCGKKPNGSQCSAGADCDSNLCAQGVCCNSACTETCKACNLRTSLGLCSTVADGVRDPQGKCLVNDGLTCGTTGTCKQGDCAYTDKGTRCKDGVCATNSSMTPVSTCNGVGNCETPANRSCGTFICEGTDCKIPCLSDKDCISPNTCVQGSCGLLPPGAACTAGNKCASGFCTEGVCCDTACSDSSTGGLCKSCKVSGKVGTCTLVPMDGADPKNQCKASDAGKGDCSNSGTCNGAGACKPWDTGKGCRNASCAEGIATANANCDGKGACPAASTTDCDPYVCSLSSPSCLNTCSTDANCKSGLTCLKTNNRCGGKLANGDACKANTDCTSNFCSPEGVCCNSACTGACQSCTLTGKAGTCSNIASGGNPRNTTTCSTTSNVCGNTGRCDGNNGCQLANAGLVCGSTACAPGISGTLGGGTVTESISYIPAPACNGTGTCVTPSAVSCGAFQCDATARACKTTCSSSGADCNAIAPPEGGGNSCVGGTCQKNPNGTVCTDGFTCASGFCVDGTCCGTPMCFTCRSCAVPNAQGVKDGVCQNIARGTTELHGLCVAGSSATCGLDGKCDGSGVCTNFVNTTCTPDRSTCADSRHMVAASGLCSGSGTACTPGTPVACGTGFMCVSGACATSCTPANQSTICDTSNGYSCISGVCSKPGAGAPCSSANTCSTGNCVDGVCCTTASCPTCKSCNVTGSAGTCTNVPNQTADRTCVATCPSTTQTSGLCSAGVCQGSRSCGAGYLCEAGTCHTSCTTENQATACATGYVCASGTCKKVAGQSCTGNAECGSNVCTQGVCCNLACTGECQTCTATGSVGTCTSIGPGGTPRGTTLCPLGSTCGNTGLCNGTGACQVAAANTSCTVTQTCSGNTLSGPAGACDGAGVGCNPVISSCPTGYACANGTSCATTCTGTSTGCASGYICNGTTCVLPLANGTSCTTDSQCANLHCVGTTGVNSAKVCCFAACATDVVCGVRPLCAVGGAACQTHVGEACGVASCSDATSRIPVGTCTGTGLCTQTTIPCDSGYTCSGGACVQSLDAGQ